MVFLGVYPKPVLDRIQPSVEVLFLHVEDVAASTSPVRTTVVVANVRRARRQATSPTTLNRLGRRRGSGPMTARGPGSTRRRRCRRHPSSGRAVAGDHPRGGALILLADRRALTPPSASRACCDDDRGGRPHGRRGAWPMFTGDDITNSDRRVAVQHGRCGRYRRLQHLRDHHHLQRVIIGALVADVSAP